MVVADTDRTSVEGDSEQQLSPAPVDADTARDESEETSPETVATAPEADETADEADQAAPEASETAPDTVAVVPATEETAPATPAVIPLPPVEAPARLTSGRPTPARPTPGRPTPGRPTPTSGPRPSLPASPRPSASKGSADEPSVLQEAMAFGRVDEAGTVYVRSSAGEREVGTWAPGESEQALIFFARRYATLESEVELAEGRARAGALGAEATAATAERLAAALSEAQVVGDLAALAARIRELPELSLERREARKAEKAQAQAEARTAKDLLVAEAEQIALSDTWRAGPERLRELFDVWRTMPRLDKAADDELWHRFSAARTSFTRRRKIHYSELAGKRAEVKAAKEALITEAEKLAASTDWGSSTAAERDLMARWKQVGSASKDDDDALWNRFHTARQAFFDARAAHDEERSSGEKENLAAKRAVLVEAEALLPVTDLAAARRAMRGIRERWEAVGHIPRGAVAGLDTRWKAVDEAVRGAEKHEWRRTDPEARRRAEQTSAQLQKSIAKLETEAKAAVARGDKGAQARAEEALTARRAWLEQAEKLLTESR